MKKIIPFIKALFKRVRNVHHEDASGKEDRSERDVENVVRSSRLFQISEFRFFQLAYFQWYGRTISEKQLEPIFADYMLRNEVPHWARHCARQVLSRYSHGILDPLEYGIECSMPPDEGEGPLDFLSVFMAFTYLIFFLILSGQITFQ